MSSLTGAIMNQFYPRETKHLGCDSRTKAWLEALVEKQTVATETAVPHASCTGALLLEISDLFSGSSVEHHPVSAEITCFSGRCQPLGGIMEVK